MKRIQTVHLIGPALVAVPVPVGEMTEKKISDFLRFNLNKAHVPDEGRPVPKQEGE